MTLPDVIKFYERLTGLTGDKAVAKGMGLSKGRISHWRKSGIPYSCQCRIQVESNGALMASKGRLKVGDGKG